MRPWLNAPSAFISRGTIMVTTHTHTSTYSWEQKTNILTFKYRDQQYYKGKNSKSIRIYLISGWTTCYLLNSKHPGQRYVSSWKRGILTVFFRYCFSCNSFLTKIRIQNNRTASIWDKKFLPKKEKEIYQFLCNLDSPYIVKQGMLW